MNKFLYVPFIVAASFAVPMLITPMPVLAQQMPAKPQVEHVALSVALAKQAIDATLFIRKNYKDRKFTDADPAGMISTMKARGVYNKMLVELRGFGFASPEQWSKTAVSTAIAVGFVKNGDGQKNMMAQMQQMQKDSRMSDQMKAQIMATMRAVMPPQKNIDVAKEILADRSYAAKVKELFDN